ncbi:MAG: hypothetical protein U5K31_05670 [Balneolaceae bacterium]|nr:hypothetical protein [Balneolaceae bacterium]
MNIYEIVRRWHQGQTISGIARTLRLDRKTVRRYIQSAQQAGIQVDTPLGEESEVMAALEGLASSTDRRKPAADQFEPYREEILGLLQVCPDPLTLKSAWQVIRHRYPEITASYSSLKRAARRWRPQHRFTWRHETPPGMQTQIDYAKMGLLYDPLQARRRVLAQKVCLATSLRRITG